MAVSLLNIWKLEVMLVLSWAVAHQGVCHRGGILAGHGEGLHEFGKVVCTYFPGRGPQCQ